MLVSQLIKSTLDIQGFCVGQLQGDTNAIIVDIVPDRRHSLFCSSCGSASKYRYTLATCGIRISRSFLKNAPGATMVFDKFHIIRHLNEAVDQIRRDVIREEGKEHRGLIKDT